MMKRLLALAALSLPLLLQAAEQPNILWITSEDNGPHLGCYGDAYAVTPNLDKLAGRGMRYTNCWSTAPVCAAARTCLITGMYGISTGGQHMRSMNPLPAAVKMYPEHLRAAGYHCTNGGKEDYNHPHTNGGNVWDKGSWADRSEGQPFFAIKNFTISHESKLRDNLDERERIHDPAGARVPAYHPDNDETRRNWAQYYDRMTMMDRQAGETLAQLEADGLAEDTIIFYYGDHGSGMPRSKRMPYNSGLQVPLIIHVPEKWRHLAPEDYAVGGQSDAPVGFVDLTPTVISLAGAAPPANMQGTAFMGEHAAGYSKYNYAFRGRMDERPDCIRSITDGNHVYIRSFNPHRPWGQYVAYMFVTQTTQKWHDLYVAGELNEAQSMFWKPSKPSEELYDLKADPDEVNNLVGDPAHRDTLGRLRDALFAWQAEIRDVGMLPEDEMHRLAGGKPIREALADDATYPFAEVHAAADLATRTARADNDNLTTIVGYLDHAHSGIRYWGAVGLLLRGEAGVSGHEEFLVKVLDDESPSVRIAAAEALGRYGAGADMEKVFDVLLTAADPSKGGTSYAAIHACNALDYLDQKAAPVRDRIAALPQKFEGYPRTDKYTGNVIRKAVADLDGVDFKALKLDNNIDQFGQKRDPKAEKKAERKAKKEKAAK